MRKRNERNGFMKTESDDWHCIYIFVDLNKRQQEGKNSKEISISDHFERSNC